jgi:hypothetical protein
MSHDLVISRSNSLPARRSAKSRIELRRISDLKFNPRNPRQHPPKQIAQIAASIREFGMLVPVLVDQNNHVIAGHGRIFACQKLGWREVPTIRVDIADNRLTENAVWDEDLLGEALLDLSLSELDFDIEITGFETAEIDLWPLRTCHSARRTRDRRHPANFDPYLPVANVRCRAG